MDAVRRFYMEGELYFILYFFKKINGPRKDNDGLGT